MAAIEFIDLPFLDHEQADAAAKLLAAAGEDRLHEVLTVTGGFRVPVDIAAAAGFIEAPAKPVAKKTPADS